ncbi:UNVERIFIED_CONTAM: zgc [Trichonephila clavipes]
MAECQQMLSSDASFEDQIFWCLKHLEEKLQGERVSPREAQSILKSIKLLRSKRTSFVQKRQVMRLACGDYRKKMEEEVETTKQRKNFYKCISFIFGVVYPPPLNYYILL